MKKNTIKEPGSPKTLGNVRKPKLLFPRDLIILYLRIDEHKRQLTLNLHVTKMDRKKTPENGVVENVGPYLLTLGNANLTLLQQDFRPFATIRCVYATRATSPLCSNAKSCFRNTQSLTTAIILKRHGRIPFTQRSGQ